MKAVVDLGGRFAFTAVIDDGELVARLRGGEEEAFTVLVGMYQSRLLRLAGTVVASRSVAEEVVQDTWLAVVRGVDRRRDDRPAAGRHRRVRRPLRPGPRHQPDGQGVPEQPLHRSRRLRRRHRRRAGGSRQQGLANVTFEVKDAAALDGSTRFDFITVFDAVHDQAKPDVVLKGIADSLGPGGVFLCVDIAGSSHVEQHIDHPMAPMLSSVSTFHCMTVSLALDGAGLGTMWDEQKADEMFREAGFSTVGTKRVPEDILNVFYVCRKDHAATASTDSSET